MDYNSSNYFNYKKNKIKMGREIEPRPTSRFNFFFQLFIATFIVIFIVIVIAIMNYSSKMDIEYSKGGLSGEVETDNLNTGDDVQQKIDKRLSMIQQEENAPSEAKYVTKEKETHNEIIDPAHIEESQKIDKIEKQKAKNATQEKTSATPEVKLQGKKQVQDNFVKEETNVIIMSKVLIGRYATFDDAQNAQGIIKASENNVSPYVKKIGDVFTVQMGSYQDFAVAKRHAQALKAKGYDVWIYQQ